MKEKTNEPDLPALLRKALQIPAIQQELLRINGIEDIGERGYHDYFICRVLKYLSFMRTTDGIEDFLAIQKNYEEERSEVTEKDKKYFKKAIAKILHIPEEQIDERENEIYEYAFERSYIYGLHSTIETDKIIDKGFMPLDEAQERLDLNTRLEKYGINNMFSCAMGDIKNKRKSSFF